MDPVRCRHSHQRESRRPRSGLCRTMVDDGELPAEVVVPETTKRRRSTPPETASTPLASAMAAHMESVILIEVTAVSPNFIQPWKMHGQRQSSGSGFIISNRRIITNHHVVKDAIDVRLRKHGVARRWRGKVVVSAHDVSARHVLPSAPPPGWRSLPPPPPLPVSPGGLGHRDSARGGGRYVLGRCDARGVGSRPADTTVLGARRWLPHGREHHLRDARGRLTHRLQELSRRLHGRAQPRQDPGV